MPREVVIALVVIAALILYWVGSGKDDYDDFIGA